MVTSISNAISSCVGSFNSQPKAIKVALGVLAVGVLGLGGYALITWIRKDDKAPDVTPKKEQETSFDSSEKLPTEMWYIIFSNMNVSGLGRCAQVCKKWRVWADDERQWMRIVRSQVLGKKVWEEARVGDVGDEPEYRMAAFNGMGGEVIPWKEVCKMHKYPSTYRDLSNKLVMTRMPEFDFLVPATINGLPTTINRVIEVFKHARLPIGCSYIDSSILARDGDVPIEESYFARLTWTVANDTRAKKPDVQIDEINKKEQGLYRLPKIIEMMIFQFLSYQEGIKSGYGNDPPTWSQCIETLTIGMLGVKEAPFYAGGFKKPAPDAAGGLFVSFNTRVYDSDGSGGLRKL